MSAPFWVQVDAGFALGLGAIFTIAAVRKLQHVDVFALTLRRLDRSPVRRASVTRRLVFVVAICELTVAAGVNAFRGTAGFLFACAAVVLCTGFVAALLRAIQQSVPCACFGRLGRTAAGGREIARALVLLGGAVFLVVHRAVEPGTAYGFGAIAAMSALAFLVVVAGAQRVGARIRPGSELPNPVEHRSLGDALRLVAGVDNELYAPRAPAPRAR
jgi:Methylamine utilisation protein MauE